MNIIVACPFHDTKAKNVLRMPGEVIDCTDERARQLVALNLAYVANEQPKTATKRTRKTKQEG